MMDEEDGRPARELYALLHVSPDATNEEIRKAYRQWAQIYHPDKIQAPHMKETAAENFRRINEAYNILSDKNKRKLYDIYGMKGLALGTNLDNAQEMKEELEKLMKFKEQVKVAAAAAHSTSTVSFSDLLSGGMAIHSFMHSQISDRSMLYIGGNLAFDGSSGGGGGAATLVYRYLLSPVSTVDVFGSAGLSSLVAGVQTTRRFSRRVTGTMGLAVGSRSAVTLELRKEKESSSTSGHVKLGTTFLEASGKYTRRFSENVHGHLQGTIGSHDLGIQVGGGRKVSECSNVGMAYSLGLDGIFWKLELQHKGQKFVVPISLSTQWHAFIAGFATAAFLLPTWLYSSAKKLILEYHSLKRNSAKVRKGRAAAHKAKKLLRNVAIRNKKKQREIGGLVITKALYGSVIARGGPSRWQAQLQLGRKKWDTFKKKNSTGVKL